MLGIVVSSLGSKALFVFDLGLLAHADKERTDGDPESNQDCRVDDVVPGERDIVAHDLNMMMRTECGRERE